jgi:hypothetical protein
VHSGLKAGPRLKSRRPGQDREAKAGVGGEAHQRMHNGAHQWPQIVEGHSTEV